ncbi:DUF4377 domain-containing protein [Acinetobacter sichuanensis]|uniref:DUF4377 domain-containing protein n=1 Tax=Acinetobacter sichuanensis TaxID=2136183 RepID=A0A371YQY5_9GAMM|nr:DUF4377 domain-containing protein [Acinetobacter sichuanensis]RFC83887.1 DUF4377 domain-containing protein [Acinetobacter sichuanensis]
MLKQIVALSFSLVITSHLMAQSTAPQAHYETIFMEIAPQKRVCHGIGVTECLQYKKFVFDENGQKIYKNSAWYNLYTPIEGYEHNPTRQATLRIKSYSVKNPPADSSSVRYVLEKQI